MSLAPVVLRAEFNDQSSQTRRQEMNKTKDRDVYSEQEDRQSSRKS